MSTIDKIKDKIRGINKSTSKDKNDDNVKPLRCYTCGKILNYNLPIFNYQRYCCRRMILGFKK